MLIEILCFHTSKQDCREEMLVSNAGADSRRSRYFHFTFPNHTNTPMPIEVIFITKKTTNNYSLLSLSFQKHKH